MEHENQMRDLVKFRDFILSQDGTGVNEDNIKKAVKKLNSDISYLMYKVGKEEGDAGE